MLSKLLWMVSRPDPALRRSQGALWHAGWAGSCDPRLLRGRCVAGVRHEEHDGI